MPPKPPRFTFLQRTEPNYKYKPNVPKTTIAPYTPSFFQAEQNAEYTHRTPKGEAMQITADCPNP